MGTRLFLSASVRIHLGFVTAAQPASSPRSSTDPLMAVPLRVQHGPCVRAGPSATQLGDKVEKRECGTYPVASSIFILSTGHVLRGHYYCKKETLEGACCISGSSSSVGASLVGPVG